MRAVCGIAGFFGPRSTVLLTAMLDALIHRGPDGGGNIETDAASIGVRRLRIVDLSAGDEPVTTADGRLHLVYNGEVYNFRELRAELEALGHRFRTNADTEVVLEAYAEWGSAAFGRFNGMWALALLDVRGDEPRLILCRDHFGIKPLYYGRWGGRIVFASEIKAILADPSFPRRVNDDAMFDYLAYGLFDHSSATFFDGIDAAPAASFVEIDAHGMRTERYWTPRLSEDGSSDPRVFRALFERAVARRLVSDVPVGTCLSGGLDSSSITVVLADLLAKAHRDTKSLGPRLQTFSAVFPDDSIDESGYIDSVIEATHAVSHRVAPTHRGLIAELDELVRQVEMPMVSSAPYAMWEVMRIARDHVTVLIDGQGGDELLGGYDVYPYVYLRELFRARRLRQLIVEAVRWRSVLLPLVANRVMGRFRGSPDVAFLTPAFRQRHARPVDDRSHDNVKLRLLQDLTRYSLPPLLRYEDRISMLNAIETRLPFLDQELVEAVLRLPTAAILDHGRSRRILREALRGLLPTAVYRRVKKIGFTTPEFRWFNDEQPALLRILRSPSFTSRPYWNAPDVTRAFRAACEGKGRRSLFFWRVINAEIWLRVYIDPPAGQPTQAPAT